LTRDDTLALKTDLLLIIRKLFADQYEKYDRVFNFLYSVLSKIDPAILDSIRSNQTYPFEKTTRLESIEKASTSIDLLNRFCNDEIMFLSIVSVAGVILGCFVTCISFLIYGLLINKFGNRSSQ